MSESVVAEVSGVTEEQEVWQVVHALNEDWTRHRGANLKRFFHPRMVAITATDARRLQGREACMASWRAFAEGAEIDTWAEHDPRIDIFGDTAIATYYYELVFRMQGHDYHVKGRDMVTLVRDFDNWWVVADHFSTLPG
ncbi:MAG: nuclear transport factor 2 family protein [Gammaproteobacteria bacterium]|nr:nuclear transport factor 2 family protein [Gammaproteobacteria bacterium]